MTSGVKMCVGYDSWVLRGNKRKTQRKSRVWLCSAQLVNYYLLKTLIHQYMIFTRNVEMLQLRVGASEDHTTYPFTPPLGQIWLLIFGIFGILTQLERPHQKQNGRRPQSIYFFKIIFVFKHNLKKNWRWP
jgi:hypothetical protein